jgi:hypothetical protein
VQRAMGATATRRDETRRDETGPPDQTAMYAADDTAQDCAPDWWQVADRLLAAIPRECVSDLQASTSVV